MIKFKDSKRRRNTHYGNPPAAEAYQDNLIQPYSTFIEMENFKIKLKNREGVFLPNPNWWNFHQKGLKAEGSASLLLLNILESISKPAV